MSGAQNPPNNPRRRGRSRQRSKSRGGDRLRSPSAADNGSRRPSGRLQRVTGAAALEGSSRLETDIRSNARQAQGAFQKPFMSNDKGLQDIAHAQHRLSNDHQLFRATQSQELGNPVGGKASHNEQGLQRLSSHSVRVDAIPARQNSSQLIVGLASQSVSRLAPNHHLDARNASGLASGSNFDDDRAFASPSPGPIVRMSDESPSVQQLAGFLWDESKKRYFRIPRGGLGLESSLGATQEGAASVGVGRWGTKRSASAPRPASTSTMLHSLEGPMKVMPRNRLSVSQAVARQGSLRKGGQCCSQKFNRHVSQNTFVRILARECGQRYAKACGCRWLAPMACSSSTQQETENRHSGRHRFVLHPLGIDGCLPSWCSTNDGAVIVHRKGVISVTDGGSIRQCIADSWDAIPLAIVRVQERAALLPAQSTSNTSSHAQEGDLIQRERGQASTVSALSQTMQLLRISQPSKVNMCSINLGSHGVFHDLRGGFLFRGPSKKSSFATCADFNQDAIFVGSSSPGHIWYSAYSGMSRFQLHSLHGKGDVLCVRAIRDRVAGTTSLSPFSCLVGRRGRPLEVLDVRSAKSLAMDATASHACHIEFLSPTSYLCGCIGGSMLQLDTRFAGPVATFSGHDNMYSPWTFSNSSFHNIVASVGKGVVRAWCMQCAGPPIWEIKISHGSAMCFSGGPGFNAWYW